MKRKSRFWSRCAILSSLGTGENATSSSFSSDHLLELTRRGATKGGMILKLAKLLGVARKDIYCIGDHNNDIPMLEVSEIGFAPENAIPEVKEWGAHIVCHCKDGALADVVEILDKRY
ncbi:MAG: HAD family hydrolase [Oscillibacter sp.]